MASMTDQHYFGQSPSRGKELSELTSCPLNRRYFDVSVKEVDTDIITVESLYGPRMLKKTL